MDMQSLIKKIMFVFGTIAVVVAILLYRSWYPPTPQAKEHWLVIFIHGSFNTGLGLLSAKNVFKDEIQGTSYANVVNRMRKDPFFYQEQAIMQRGLVKLNPSFNHPMGSYKFATYPIMSAYKEVLETLKPGHEINHFYTFGWTGLLSKTYRLKESLRLYNALQEELENYKQQGITPKIRLIAHSHGGNVCLNIAALNQAQTLISQGGNIHDCIENDTNRHVDEKEALKHAVTMLSSQQRSKPLGAKGQKKFDYYPVQSPLIIDETVLYGSPIQPETSHFVNHPTLKKVYNFYSDQDVVQGTDFVSSKHYYSAQRFDKDLADKSRNLIQGHILVERNLNQRSAGGSTAHNTSWWKRLLYGLLFTEESKEPTHKDLWFLAWNKEYTQPLFPLNPLPVVIVTPLLTYALEQMPAIRDADLNMRFSPAHLKLEVARYNEEQTVASSLLNINIIDSIRSRLEYWRPDNLSRETTSKKMRSFISEQVTSTSAKQ